eukprot:TRINITY_DN2813_c0_g1_i1.p1 TRINITY_DN2813_c0_g1~~TRINITY_DN2813_c0_g1_i1.p1  ORF type:complete len:173 (+),score=25.63 TRINITY_DN2813_c0_g1_i1:449-967(+)
MEIPYTEKGKYKPPLMFKPLVYANDELDVIASSVVYKLNTYLANMTINSDNTYYQVINKQNQSLTAQFYPQQENFSSVNKFPLFNTSYYDINQYPWLCKDIVGLTKCAYNNYNFTTAQARPVKVSLSIENGVLGQSFPPGLYNVDSVLKTPLGGVEIISDLYITSSSNCPKS